MKHLLILTVLFIPLLGFCQDLVINEFLAANDTIAADPSGEFDDWIELFNNSSSDISLAGMFLSDDPSELDKWSFPDVTIPANDFLIIWADNDEGQPGIHTNFKISASGESIHLSDSNLEIIDEVYFEVQIADISMGRFPNGTGNFIQMYPSFNSTNLNNYMEEDEDLTIPLFDDSYVHKFALQFYVDNWEDSLLYNYENGEVYMPVQLTYNDTLVFENIGVRYKGNSSFVQSSNTPKKPFKFRFDKYVSNQLLCGVSKLNFSNCIKDPSFVREKIAYEIIGKYVPSPRTAYSEIYINDELIGLYVQVEQIDEYFLDRNFNESSGNLFKAHDDGSTMQYYGSEQTLYESEFDLKTNENANDWSDLVMLLDNLNNSSDEDFYSVMEQYLDFDSCARNLAFNMVLSHFDSYTGSGRNFYLYHENSSDRFLFLPWDLNESFGAYSNNWDVFTQDILNISNLSQRPLNKRFLENETLSELYKNYIVEMISGPAAYDSISVKAEELKAFIDPYVLADNNKLYSYQDFLDNIENDVFIGIGELVPGIKSFSEQRNAALETQLTTTQVFPGDTDNNGVVDELDILPIGVYFLTEGNPRNTQSFSWQSFQVQNWDNPAAAFADANGDGIINEIDVIGIGINWGNTHQNPAFSYEIDLNDTGFLKQYESNFSSIYHNLNGESEAEDRMKSLLESVFGFEEEDENNPVMFLQNSPNPFNQQTTIFYGISAENSENIEINIYNVKGQKVRQFSDINDRTSVIWDGKDENGKKVDSGVYFYAGKFKNVVIKSKMLLIKE